MPATASAAGPLLATGTVRHLRLRPARHGFEMRTWFVLLPLRRLRAAPAAALARNRAALVSFHDRDHGDGGPDALAWFDALMLREGLDQRVDGEVWLQTYPRVLGYAFKPVSFWYGHRADGTLAVVLAEVNNTFGERHLYLLDGPDVGFGRTLTTRKVFHVSPFCRVDGSYRFRFARSAGQVVARIDHHDAAGAPLLRTSVGGRLEPLTRGALRHALASMPLLTFGVIARIHWQALRLFAKRVPFFAKPAPPGAFLSR
ncbi:MAG: DUF1365 domain-containing protein [Rubrivivax sp.]